MIKHLRRRLTLLVIGVLVLVTAGIVFSIDSVNRQNIRQQAEKALQALAAGGGARPGASEKVNGEIADDDVPGSQNGDADDAHAEPPEKPGFDQPPEKPDHSAESNSDDPPPKPPENPDSPPREGGPADRDLKGEPLDAGLTMARLSNYCTIELNEQGEIVEWTSDRTDLYDADQIAQMVETVLASEKTTGAIGDQFFRLESKPSGSMLIILDARLEWISARQVLRTTALVASLACLALSVGATLLIRRMVTPVQRAFDKQRQFVWDASHELKTPLAVISANAEVLRDQIAENVNLDYILSEVRRADKLITNLLTLARLDRDAVRSNRQSIDLSRTILSVALPFESTVFEAGKTLNTDVPANIRAIADADQMAQLTVILLSNALKYSDAHGTIDLVLRKKGRGCEMIVRNTGEGISPADLCRIFDRFYRCDASHNAETGGNGLGLAIAKEIVRTHGGTITAHSEYGEGAEFVVVIP